jgi:hypothetical protein
MTSLAELLKNTKHIKELVAPGGDELEKQLFNPIMRKHTILKITSPSIFHPDKMNLLKKLKFPNLPVRIEDIPQYRDKEKSDPTGLTNKNQIYRSIYHPGILLVERFLLDDAGRELSSPNIHLYRLAPGLIHHIADWK